jgi:hypothetical protein
LRYPIGEKRYDKRTKRKIDLNERDGNTFSKLKYILTQNVGIILPIMVIKVINILYTDKISGIQ